MKPGVVTNNFITPDGYRSEIAAGSLYVHDWSGNLLLLRKRDGYHLLTFYLNDLNMLPDIALPPDTVTEIPQKPSGANPDAVEYWMQIGDRQTLKRIRLTRKSDQATALYGRETFALCATPEDFNEIHALLRDSFDHRTGCLPSETELCRDIADGAVMCVRDGPICGVLRMSARSKSVEICHLAVREDMRGRGVAYSLVQAFVERYGDKKSTVWMVDGYAPALKVYTAAGFVPDGWRSVVLSMCGGNALS